VKREWRGHIGPEADLVSAAPGWPECDVSLRALQSSRVRCLGWSEYWAPVEAVVDFKREVYRLALSELERFLTSDARSSRAPSVLSELRAHASQALVPLSKKT